MDTVKNIPMAGYSGNGVAKIKTFDMYVSRDKGVYELGKEAKRKPEYGMHGFIGNRGWRPGSSDVVAPIMPTSTRRPASRSMLSSAGGQQAQRWAQKVVSLQHTQRAHEPQPTTNRTRHWHKRMLTLLFVRCDVCRTSKSPRSASRSTACARGPCRRRAARVTS